MAAIAATFGLCLAIVLGAYWTFVIVPENKSARKLRKRLLWHEGREWVFVRQPGSVRRKWEKD